MTVADSKADIGALIYGGRRYPGICEGEHCTVNGEDVELFRDRAGLPIARVECRACGRRWTRVGE